LANETATITAYAAKAQHRANDLSKDKDKVKDQATKNSQTVENKLQKAREKEAKRHEAFTQKIAQEKDSDMRSLMNKQEVQRQADANKAIDDLLKNANQWHKIAGQQPLQ